jgi:hypothetical protein
LYKVYVCEHPSFTQPYRVYTSDWIAENHWQTPALEEALGVEGKLFFWKVCAKDLAGNLGENSPAENFRVDNLVPKVALFSPENCSLVSGTVEFEWYPVTDGGSGLWGYWFQLSTAEDFTHLLENAEVRENRYLAGLYLAGDYYWRVCAIDNAGNRGPWSDPFTVRVSGWIIIESWQSTSLAPRLWREVESLQASCRTLCAWREVESRTSSETARREWRRLDCQSLRVASPASWIQVQGISATAGTPAPPPSRAWSLLEGWEATATQPTRWLEVDSLAGGTSLLSLALSPERASVEQGGVAYVIVRLEGRYPGTARLEAGVVPGVTVTLSPSEGVPTFQSILKVEAGASVQIGTHELGIRATAGGLVLRKTLVLEVRPPTRLSPPLSAGARENFDFSDLKIPINRVEVLASDNVLEPYVTLELLPQPPPGIPVPGLPVYIYARVRTNIPNRSVRFSLTVEDSWLRTHGTRELVCMLRAGEKWEEVSAKCVGENAGRLAYEVEVPWLPEASMLAIACRPPARVPFLLLFVLALGAGIGGWFLLHWLRPRPAFRPTREALRKVREVMKVKPPRRMILERYKKAVVYRRKPRVRTVTGMADTRKIMELWESLSRRTRRRR